MELDIETVAMSVLLLVAAIGMGFLLGYSAAYVRCDICGAVKYHHSVTRLIDGNNTVIVCSDCHAKAELAGARTLMKE